MDSKRQSRSSGHSSRSHRNHDYREHGHRDSDRRYRDEVRCLPLRETSRLGLLTPYSSKGRSDRPDYPSDEDRAEGRHRRAHKVFRLDLLD